MLGTIIARRRLKLAAFDASKKAEDVKFHWHTAPGQPASTDGENLSNVKTVYTNIVHSSTTKQQLYL